MPSLPGDGQGYYQRIAKALKGEERKNKMRNLEEGEEVMLTNLSAMQAHLKYFNPNYGLVVKDLGWGVKEDLSNDWKILVLWEDGQERTFQRGDLMPLADLEPKRA